MLPARFCKDFNNIKIIIFNSKWYDGRIHKDEMTIIDVVWNISNKKECLASQWSIAYRNCSNLLLFAISKLQ
jgi:hypothetical protein